MPEEERTEPVEIRSYEIREDPDQIAREIGSRLPLPRPQLTQTQPDQTSLNW